MVPAGESKFKAVLKWRTSLENCRAQNAEHSENARNWNVTGASLLVRPSDRRWPRRLGGPEVNISGNATYRDMNLVPTAR